MQYIFSLTICMRETEKKKNEYGLPKVNCELLCVCNLVFIN